MEDSILKVYQDQAKAQDTWTIKELKEFFEVSHTTVRKRIKDGELTATTEETKTGKRYEVTGEELSRNISQSETLQDYLKEKTEDKDQEGPDDPGGRPPYNFTRELYKENERKNERIAGFREKLAECKTERKHLEKENQDLRATLNELTEAKELPAGSIFKPWTWFNSKD